MILTNLKHNNGDPFRKYFGLDCEIPTIGYKLFLKDLLVMKLCGVLANYLIVSAPYSQPQTVPHVCTGNPIQKLSILILKRSFIVQETDTIYEIS